MYRKKFTRLAEKIRREKIEKKKGRKIKALMFDERKDLTRVGGYNVSREENCTIVIFPGKKNEGSEVDQTEDHEEEVCQDQHLWHEVEDEVAEQNVQAYEKIRHKVDQGEYLGHCRPESGTGVNLAAAVLSHLESYEADITDLNVVLTDGTSKMTGQNGGAVAVMEQKLQRPIQRGVCLNHHLEKPFEHLFEYYDGKSSGPKTYVGPIGKEIEGDDLHKRDIVNFEVISNPDLLSRIQEIPEKYLKEMSRDYQWGVGIAKILITGEVTKWAHQKCGNIHQARWWNREIRICR